MGKDPHERVDYDRSQHGTYEAGRRLAPATCALWIEAVRRHLAVRSPARLLDLGAGTGRFAGLLADGLGVDVVGVEPAERMRAIAKAEHAHPRVTYVAGEGAAIPLPDASVDAVWMSMVAHHVPDLAAAAAEIRRVTRPGGVVLVRSSFSGRLGSARFYAFFPRAHAADEARLPTIEHVRSVFEGGGLRFRAHDVVTQVLDDTWAHYVARIRQRALSSFEFVTDEEFATGVRAMEEAGRQGEPEPVTEDIDLLVFDRP